MNFGVRSFVGPRDRREERRRNQEKKGVATSADHGATLNEPVRCLGPTESAPAP